jgi:hypothetical protein
MEWLLKHIVPIVGVPSGLVALFLLRDHVGRALLWVGRRFVPTQRERDTAEILKSLAQVDAEAKAIWTPVYNDPSHAQTRKRLAEHNSEWLRLTVLLRKLDYPGVMPLRDGWEELEAPPPRNPRSRF